MSGDSKQPLGVIVDTNSKGRFDLIIYDDGILAVKGTYVGVALRGGGAGMVGAGGGGLGGAATAGAGAAGGAAGAKNYEGKRLAKLLEHPRPEIVDLDPKNFFVPQDVITGIVLRKRWHGCSLTINTQGDTDGRKFSWKPALNNFSYVHDVVVKALGNRLALD